MKFLIDAQLPRRITYVIREYGYEAIHTLDLPQQNQTSDNEIMQYADNNSCIVTTKDSDFVNSFYIQQTPQKLWLLSTGNITNADLEQLIRSNLPQIATLFVLHRFIELSRDSIIIRA